MNWSSGSPQIHAAPPIGGARPEDGQVEGFGRARRLEVGRVQVFGAFWLALFFLGASKWGAYIIPGPPYIGDICLAGLLAIHVLAATKGKVADGGLDPLIGTLASALLAWAAIRLLFSGITIDSLRDAAPYLYVVVAFLVLPLSDEQAERAGRLLMIVLIAHAAWVTLSTVFGSSLSFLPVLSAPSDPEEARGIVHVFSVRTDFDPVIAGVMAAICLHRALLGKRPVLNLALAGWGAVLAVSIHSRAAVLAFVIQMLVVALAATARRRERQNLEPAPRAERRSRQGQSWLAVGLIIAALPFVLYFARDATPVQRLEALLPTASSAAGPSYETGTAGARYKAWNRIAEWLNQDPGRSLVGVGFGTNYIVSSGAAPLLEGGKVREGVRSPHSIEVGTWARLGIAGAILITLLLLAGLFLSWRVINLSPQLRELDLLAALVACSLPVVASFGVILESPFGAIPYFWAVGHLSVRICQLGGTPTLSQLIKHQSPKVGPRT